MLELRPSCEHCNTALPPDSEAAMICSFECTFCRHCVDNVLFNVCPNCGGGFCARPVRPSQNLKNNACLAFKPASVKVVHSPVDPDAHERFSRPIRDIPPTKR